ncbi:site-specific integrase [Pseudomonas syringae group genomosp. 3]|uniref:site-specific integrase n=1 Tax=Pseudomonas syringae group genomosp. 3 TaxID=251701 RepID=UPI0006CCD671|nr:site-specific integrase [Pseudomonas syringae group genomosp. 3]KPB89052.1 Phage integrase family protein [Pseudomonas syringae pv. maculicola str. M6]KPX76303.1 hypothetical protein ALO84_200099 [Pseudomonas syringae pv. maculicola]
MTPVILQKGRVIQWYESTCTSPVNLLALELDRDKFDNELYLSDAYIAEHNLCEDLELFALTERCLITQLFVDGYLDLDERSVSGHNWSLKLQGWYAKLTDTEKKAIPIFGNKIGIRGLARQVEEFKTLGNRQDYPGVRIALDNLNAQHLEAGYLDPNYVPVKERSKGAPGEVLQAGADSLEFQRLLNLRINHVDELEASSAAKPFQELKHLFAYVVSFNDAWRPGLLAFNYFTGFLKALNFTGIENLFDTVGPYSLVRFRAWLVDRVVEKEIAPSTANTALSKVRRCFKMLSGIFGAEDFIFYDVEGFDPVRVTELYTPYSLLERERIASCVDADIELYNRLSKPYVVSGVGVDPFEDDQKKIRCGHATLENMRWVFENRLSCIPPTHEQFRAPGYAFPFVNTINKLVGNIQPVYTSWGVLQHVDSGVIAPFVIKLAQITGLNADSLKWLDLDDYTRCHPFTKRPCLRYWKERSTGKKMYPLDLVEAEITWLTAAQSKEVEKVFEAMKALTSRFRHEASEEISSKLFIWQSTGAASYGEIKSLATAQTSIVSRLFSNYAKSKNLLDDNGEPLSLSASRLRPSFISELVDKGVSVREIQVVLGHANLRTTVGYLDRMDFNRFARKKLDATLTSIHQGAVEAYKRIDSVSVTAPDDMPQSNFKDRVPSVVFKTPLADCANIFNPPEFVTRLASYVPGTPCAMYNKCLACDNSIITVSHLPQLFAMQRDYSRLVEVSRVMDTPYGFVVKENMALLKTMLHPETSDFSEGELKEAQRLSEYIETTILIDGVGV